MVSMARAWLITWRGIGDRVQVPQDKEIVAITSPRWPPGRIRELVEQLYLSQKQSATEIIRASRNPEDNPYPLRFGGAHATVWRGEVFCGENPFLWARQVMNLEIEVPS
jgi:hypothetical protein